MSHISVSAKLLRSTPAESWTQGGTGRRRAAATQPIPAASRSDCDFLLSSAMGNAKGEQEPRYADGLKLNSRPSTKNPTESPTSSVSFNCLATRFKNPGARYGTRLLAGPAHVRTRKCTTQSGGYRSTKLTKAPGSANISTSGTGLPTTGKLTTVQARSRTSPTPKALAAAAVSLSGSTRTEITSALCG